MADPLPLHINLADVPWEDYDSEGRYGTHDQVLAKHVTQQRLDLAITRLAPGKTNGPYHFHHVGEELFVVLEGSGQLRLGGQTYRLRPNDVVSCPPGPEGAHQFINDTDQPLVYMAISTEDDFEIAEYPDSGKVMSYVRRDGQTKLRHISRVADAVDYMAGEPV